MRIIISGYGKEGSIGLYEVSDGKFAGSVWTDSPDAPAYVCGGDNRIFAATEAGYSNFYIYTPDGRMTDSIHLEGCGALCHITYSQRHKTVYGACYGTGNIRAAKVNGSADSFTGDTSDYVQGGRAHSVMLNAAEDRLYSANIAQDLIYIYKIADGVLIPERTLDTGKGRGPRHMSLSADERLLYVITEYSNEVLVFDLSSDRLIQVISTLPAPTKETSHCSTLCFSPDRSKLYGANRFTNTVAEFTVNGDGTLSRGRWYGCGGNIPRHMITLSDGSLAVCNQESNSVDLIDTVSGERTDTLQFFKPAGIMEIDF